MKAPEKIYLEKVYPDNGVLPNGLNYTPSPTDIEYTRTDAFIDKACRWLDNFYNEGTHSYLIDEDIIKFKNYMKEE